MEDAAGCASETGFRLRVPATSLWFNVDADRWRQVRSALEGSGAEAVGGGMEGEELCGLPGLLVTYRPAQERLQSDLGAEGGNAVVACLAALRGAVPPPAAEASALWLWASEPFGIGGRQAAAALRVLRAARWVLPRDRAEVLLAAVAAAAGRLRAQDALRFAWSQGCELELVTPPDVADAGDLERRAAIFSSLVERLGGPSWGEYATFAAEA